RKNFAHSQVSRARCRRRDEEDYCPGKSLRLRGENARVEKPAGRREENSGKPISNTDHFFASDCVEEMPEQKRPENISQCKRQEIAAHILLRHVVKAHQDQRVREKDRVVEKSLGQHQHKTEK